MLEDGLTRFLESEIGHWNGCQLKQIGSKKMLYKEYIVILLMAIGNNLV